MPGAIDGVGGGATDALALYRALPQYAPLAGAGGPGATTGAAGADGTPGFAELIGAKLGDAISLQQQGSAAAQALATGQASDISAATIAVEKANISLQLVGAFRNKAIEAYQDVMHMSV